MRTVAFDVPPQEILTKDSVTVSVDAVVYARIMLDEATDRWGIKVERVEMKDVRLPVQLQRAMAAEAESSREARAKVVAAEGEQKAARALKEAADIITESPAAMQLRYVR
ncbi:hypothetical protein KUTeg_021723 [Tegillarca granosa]|uniref:Band 7 domain-containing protein n=1 Tax=Tegillarca granosa TaxID=220873 RepID=A0ABQ9E4G2_TEGGR|nr:hypothetical protein KUTeg_021723 [Tegillarca granosa]